MDDKNARLNPEQMAGFGDEQMNGRAPDTTWDGAPRVVRPANSPAPAADALKRPASSTTTEPAAATIAHPSQAAVIEQAAGVGDDVGDDVSARTRQIRSEIEQTREEMSQTVNAIQERLQPATIAANAAASVRSRAQNLAESPGVRYVREYPLPAAALACGVAGLAWLALTSRGGASDSRGSHSPRSAPYPSGPIAGSDAVDDAGEAFQASAWTVEDGGASRRRRESARGAATAASRPAGATARLRRRGWTNHPFMIGAAVAAAGAAAAAAISGPERTQAWLGQLRETLSDALPTARREIERVRPQMPGDLQPMTSLYEPDLPAGMTPEAVETVIIARPLS